MDVDAKDLEEHLSEYLAHVAAGIAIRVTDGGAPIALISPVSTSGTLRRGIEAGWIRPPKRSGRIGAIEPAMSSRRIADVLAEDRGA